MSTSTSPSKPGYHLCDIPKGELGEVSKVMEEALEAVDAHNQGASVMVLVELSDLVGAIEAYLSRHHPSMSIADLQVMAKITKRAFDNGRR